ncbi:hypothetical protein ACFE6N_06385 [Pedobacter sp. BG31]|uniref:hypothetical protein n=1 Tax=Pedobacter sp. BG31 TaxID=3349697 RepID=UPI0035F32AB6
MENQDDNMLGGKVLRTYHYKAKMSRTDVNILYSMMLLRISKGYLPEETSFLMGMGNDAIGNFEKLARKRMSMGMLMDILAALGKKSVSGFILFGSGRKADDFLCHMVRTKRTKIIEHTLYIVDDAGTERLVFKLFELNPSYFQFPNSDEHRLKETREILDVELNDNWFSPKTPLEIYQHCCLLTDQEIEPRNVMKVLEEMTSRRSYPKLLRNKANEGRKITYEKIDK